MLKTFTTISLIGLMIFPSASFGYSSRGEAKMRGKADQIPVEKIQISQEEYDAKISFANDTITMGAILTGGGVAIIGTCTGLAIAMRNDWGNIPGYVMLGAGNFVGTIIGGGGIVTMAVGYGRKGSIKNKYIVVSPSLGPGNAPVGLSLSMNF